MTDVPTRPIDAYRRGRQDRRDHPAATTWDGVLPYAVQPLTDAWLDGWYDEAGEWKLRWRRGPVEHGVVDGRCPFCWSSSMTDLPDGVLRCRLYPCWERNYPAVDREKATLFLARRDAGSYI